MTQKLNQFDAMQQKLHQLEQDLQNATGMHAQVTNLLDHGILKADASGNLWPVDDMQERQSIVEEKQSKNKQQSALVEQVNLIPSDLMSQHSF